MAIKCGEALESAEGALVVATGSCTGRSPNAKFIVNDFKSRDDINWDDNQAMRYSEFRVYRDRVLHYMNTLGDNVYSQKLYANQDPFYTLRLEVRTTLLWHSLFARNMFVQPSPSQLISFRECWADWQVFVVPEFSNEPKVLISFQDQEIIITGTYYAGEIKKSVFTVLNFLLPFRGDLPMHCSVNMGHNGEAPAIFFGLSGTGKTTLSSDENRVLVGDDEHSWSEGGLYNIEGGCYAKVIDLDRKAEPQIWHACQKRGAILENVILNDDGTPNFGDAVLTENTRASYPIGFIKNSAPKGAAPHPVNVIMLTCDAFGVLPPISKLSPDEAVEHFLLGYTAKVAGTEAGVKEPEATFSYCYGAPFMPRRPHVYADLLRNKLKKHNVDCWLVNTGWTGGPYGIGERMPIHITRRIIDGIHDGSLKRAQFMKHIYTGLTIPVKYKGIDKNMLCPENSWDDENQYSEFAMRLMDEFQKRIK
jgi:phosphoenolpyruvate carboxykinase (ATP)